jgi:6-phosphogluconolactonase (cycloisomerase 2 family)
MQFSHRTGSLLSTLFAVAAASGACDSNDDTQNGAGDDDTNAHGGSLGAAAGSGPGAGQSSGGTAGTSAENGGTGGKGAVSGGSGGKAAGSGGSGHQAGADGLAATGGSAGTGIGPGGGGASDGGEGGEGGESGDGSGAQQELAYVSTFLNGLYAFSLDPGTGAPTKLPGSPVNHGAQLYNVAIDPEGRFVYSANQATRHVDVYRIAEDGSLPHDPNSSTTIADGGPETITIDPQGRFAYVGTFEDHTVHIFTIDAGTGALTPSGAPLVLTTSPAGIAADPSGHWVYITQSAEDGIRGYSVNQTTGALAEVAESPFGPTLVRSGGLVFRGGGEFLYTSGLSLSGFSVNRASGKLTAVDGSPFTQDVQSDAFASNIAMDPQGVFVYVTNAFATAHVRGFRINPANGTLVEVPGSPLTTSTPYSIGIDPGGRFLYSGSDGGSINVFSINRASGELRETDDSPFPDGGLQPEFAFATAR